MSNNNISEEGAILCLVFNYRRFVVSLIMHAICIYGICRHAVNVAKPSAVRFPPILLVQGYEPKVAISPVLHLRTSINSRLPYCQSYIDR